MPNLHVSDQVLCDMMTGTRLLGVAYGGIFSRDGPGMKTPLVVPNIELKAQEHGDYLTCELLPNICNHVLMQCSEQPCVLAPRISTHIALSEVCPRLYSYRVYEHVERFVDRQDPASTHPMPCMSRLALFPFNRDEAIWRPMTYIRILNNDSLSSEP